MSEQHTPGPWSFAHRQVKGGMHHTQVFCAKGEAIASFAWYPMPTVNGVTGTYRQGNARLCAAAPDMLEALQMAKHIVANEGTDAQMQQVFAAIEKATGEKA